MHTLISTILFLVVGHSSLQANGFKFPYLKQSVNGGCFIGLNEWYLVLLGLMGVHLMMSLARTLHLKYTHRESPALTVFGNGLLIPGLFFAFFIYTHKMDKRLELASGAMASELITMPNFAGLKLACPHTRIAPIDLDYFSGFELVSMINYVFLFYYMVYVIVVVQSTCLIKVMAERRIASLRR